ncbi:hypothetical protein VTN77DRAFT_9316 [Rasamsonia byssochlamydoides]|uniref:uncharacterized protein n=1 Tax=Rasamsonia byssochlamydoides TaxID=89139 RepID=UPI0037444B9B
MSSRSLFLRERTITDSRNPKCFKMPRSGGDTLKVKALVAVDFGTTFSGLCWALTDKPQDTQLIQQWPGEAASHDKVPTTLLYRRNGSHFWGYEIKGTVLRHEWFKLGLYSEAEESDLVRDYPSLTALHTVYGEYDNEQLVIDYLTSLRKHAEKAMESNYGPYLFSKMAREYIITVPAVWSDRAQDRTRRCAQQAGMGDHVQIITEPEAAGIYALATIPAIGLNINDTFVLCDAGGGTVDLVSYTVAALKPIPVLYEAASGSGELCGSIFLNRIFAQLLKDRFENYPNWDKTYQADALKAFEDDIKKNFMGDTTQRYIIPARGLHKPELGIRRGNLEISGQDIRDIFEQVIPKIIALVKGQIRDTQKPVKAVLLAGGFGLSDYLRERIQDAVGEHVEVRKVANGATAIVRGALIRGLSEKQPGLATIRVKSRVARRHYGTVAYEYFVEGKHDESRRRPSPFGDRDRVEAMQWFIKKNSHIEDSNPVRTLHEFYWDLSVLNGPPRVIEMTIYVSESPVPPLYLDSNVSQLVKLSVNVSRIPPGKFPRERGMGHQWFYKIPYKIETTIHSGSIRFALVYNEERFEAKAEFV